MRLALALLMLLATTGLAHGQGTVMPSPVIEFSASNGIGPCNGCKLYHYAAGTSTLLDVYSTSTLTGGTELAQPVVLSSTGRATIYLKAASYRFALYTSANVLIWDQDNVKSIPSVSGNIDLSGVAGETLGVGQVVFLSDGNGSLTAGRWYLADADFTYRSSTATIVGFAAENITSGNTGVIRIGGYQTGLSGLTPGETYYASATAGALTLTPPTNARRIGGADTTTSIVIGGGAGAVVLPDSDGTHTIAVRTSSNLTADRTLTVVPGDASRTLTIGGDSSINQDVSTSGNPSFSWSHIAEGRLTLTSGTPVTRTDVTGASTLYYTPYKGDHISLWDGAKWVIWTFTERSLALSISNLTNYDVFLYDNGGTLTLETTAWSSSAAGTSARTTSLDRLNGVLVKNGANQRRYVGTIRGTGANTTEDSFVKRFVWNVDNRVVTPMFRHDNTNTWTWNTDSWQQARNQSANQLEVVSGLAEDAISIRVVATGTGTTVYGQVGVGENATNALANEAIAGGQGTSGDFVGNMTATLSTVPVIGYNFYTWIERAAGGTVTFYGDNGGTSYKSGISATWMR